MVDIDYTNVPAGKRNVTIKANGLDTVRGCPGGKTNKGQGCPWGCYAVDSMKRFHRLYEIPVSMELRPDLLLKDLGNCPDDWIRIGINGDPGEDWELTINTCKLIHLSGKRPVVITRAWTPPTDEILQELADHDVILHVSICAMDCGVMREKLLQLLFDYDQLGTSVMRLVTFEFKDKTLMLKQELLYKWGGFVLEQPARLKSGNPTWQEVDQSKYKPYTNHTTHETTNRWKTAGALFDGVSCHGSCPSCPNKCFTKP
jgi:hypothetical protein|tara:strand:- start:3974 stop:4747 length:774 start_codon:yes stop_codon:yes gene_type:complete